MGKGKPHIRFLMDEGVPNSVGIAFEENGHEVIYLNKSTVVMRGSPDQLVATAAIENGAVLVALDSDMKKIAKSNGVGGNRYKRLSLIKLSCSEPKAAQRITTLMSLIEHEWQAGINQERRIFIEVQNTLVRSHR